MSPKAYYYKYFLYNRIKIITYFLLLFLTFGLLLMIYIVYIYFNEDPTNNYNLLSSLGIVTSAFIASLSVMKTVYQNKKMNDDKILLEQLT